MNKIITIQIHHNFQVKMIHKVLKDTEFELRFNYL